MDEARRFSAAVRLRLAAVALVATVVSSAAAHADQPLPASPLAGFYGGGHFGWAWGTSDLTTSTAGDPASASGSIGLANPYDFAAGTGSYFAGLQGGYNSVVIPGILVGIHIDATAPSFVGGSTTLDSATAGLARFSETVEWQGTLRGRVGTLLGDWFLYGTGGWAWSWDRIERTQVGPSGLPGGSQPGDSKAERVFHTGWVAGAGAEVPIGAGWSAGLEYLFRDLGSQSLAFENGAQRLRADLVEQQLVLSANYHFGTDDAAALAPPKSGIADPANWALHGQTTYTHQYAFPFSEPYRGTNSLIPGQSRETWDATAYIGFRPWHGAELWVNAEIDQGFGLANSVGLAGFSSGEAYKLGAAYPYARVPRYFFRQTVDLGDKSEDVEADANQFAGKRTSNRAVFTVGKFSITDVFDANKFAHDPRSDFLNWSIVDTGSFDYAGDAWGFSYGASAEWFQGPWRFAFGVFTLSASPGSLAIDTSFAQLQYVAEIQHRHELWSQPGSLSITGFVSHGRMGRLDEATQIAALTGLPADIAAVRRFADRPGIAFNLEQNITKDIGVFARAGNSDGRYESFDFTDIDRSFAAGTTINGTYWGRPDDKLGIAGIVNAISKERQQFLNAGGLGILVGDGQLPHPGAEQIFETYYRFPLLKWQLTVDYQHIVNPAYNADRGPVDIMSGRLHYQF